MSSDRYSKQVLVYQGTGDDEDLWVGFTDDVTFNEALRVLNALADLADQRDLWVYVVDDWHTGVLVWSREKPEAVWEPAEGLAALQSMGGFWRVVRTAPVEQVAEGDLTAPLLLGAAGIPDAI